MKPPTIGANIKRAREAAGIKTQGALAKKMGVPQPQLSDWENDRYGAPDTKTLMKIAASIPCAFDALVEGLDGQYDASRDLIRHTSEYESASHQGGSDVPASSDRIDRELRQLRAQLADYETRFSEMQDVASRLVKLAALGSAKERGAGDQKPGRRRADRKTG